MAAPGPAKASAPPDPLIGRSLGGHYRITSLLGRGGMSRVYQAMQAPLDRAVALKVLKDDPGDSSLQRRFLLEASATSQLTHPNTITIFDYGADQGLLFFAMELLRGSTLSEVLKREGRFSEARTLHVVRQVCRSLREAHAKGLVHRDLKPSNLFLLDHADEADFVKVLDFGLVKVFGAEDLTAQLTAGGLVLGTPHYMAPEQARGLPCDQRSDIYSLGVVLFQMLAGRVPFDGASIVDVHLRHATEAVPLLRAACPGLEVSAEVEAVVAKCMAKHPDARFRNMEELLLALPGDRPNGRRPPPLPLGFDAEDDGALPLTIDAETGRLGSAGDTRSLQLTPRRPAKAQPTLPPPPPLNCDEDAPPRRGKRVAAAALAILLVAGAAAWISRSARPGRPAATVAAAAPREAAPAPALAPIATATPAAPPAAPAVAAPAKIPDPPPAPPAEPAPAPPPSTRAAHVASRRTKSTPAAASPEAIEALKERLARSVSGIRQCAMIESRRRAPGSEGGVLELSVTIDPLGRVTDIGLRGAALGDNLESCIRGAVKRVPFEPFEGSPVTVHRSVSLAPQP